MKRSNRRRRRSGGFTLMEVLLVLAILVILGSSVGFFMLGAQEKAYKRAAKAQMSTFEQMLLGYKLDVGSYPSTEQGLEALVTQPADATKWEGPYAEKAIPLDPWANPYQYENSGKSGESSREMFTISSWGPDGIQGNDDDVSNT